MFRPVNDFRQEETKLVLLYNSLTFKVGDVVALDNTGSALYLSYATNATGAVAGNYLVYGVLQGFAKADGSIYPAQGQDPINTPNQVTTAVTNTTVELIYGVVLPIKASMTFIADLDAAAGTTHISSSQPYVYFDLADARTLDESSVTAVSTPAQFLSYGVVEGQTTQVYGYFHERLLS